MAFNAAVEQVSRVLSPEAAVAVATTFGFPLGMNFAVVLFLAVQGRLDGRDPKLRAASQTASEAYVAFEEEERL